MEPVERLQDNGNTHCLTHTGTQSDESDMSTRSLRDDSFQQRQVVFICVYTKRITIEQAAFNNFSTSLVIPLSFKTDVGGDYGQGNFRWRCFQAGITSCAL